MILKDFLFIIKMLKINQIANGISKIREIFDHIVKIQKNMRMIRKQTKKHNIKCSRTIHNMNVIYRSKIVKDRQEIP